MVNFDEALSIRPFELNRAMESTNVFEGIENLDPLKKDVEKSDQTQILTALAAYPALGQRMPTLRHSCGVLVPSTHEMKSFTHM